MKRPPQPGERALIHSTEETGDVQSFAICEENFNRAVVARMPSMEHEPLMGFRLRVDSRKDGHVEFVVSHDGVARSHNSARLNDKRDVILHTWILTPMPPAQAGMLADLEQCAALALLKIV